MTTPITPDRAGILAQIAALQPLDLPALRERWTALFQQPAPGYGKVIMRQRLAYRIQELAYGGISDATRERLRAIDRQAQERAREGAKKAPDPHRPIAGTMLVKEHSGERHEVLVLAEGYQYRGQRFESLSRIASRITGTNWNGWRFFGLRRPARAAG